MDSREARILHDRAAKNTFYSLLGSLLTNGSLFLANLCLARAYSPADLGALFLVMSITGVFMVLAELGIPQAVTIRLSESVGQERSADRPERGVNSILGSSYAVGLTAGVILTVLLAALSPFFSPHLSRADLGSALVISSLWVSTSMLLKICHAVFNGFQRMEYSLLLAVLSEPGKLLVVLVALLFNASWSAVVWGWTGVYVGSMAVALAITLAFLRAKGYSPALEASSHQKKLLRQGLMLYSPVLGAFLLPYLLNIVVGRYEVQYVTYLTLCLSLTSVYFVVFSAISLTLLPVTAHLAARGESGRLVRITTTVLRCVGLSGFAILVLFHFFGAKLLKILFGLEFEGCEEFLRILTAAVFFDMFKTVLDPLLMGTGHGGLVTLLEWIKVGVILMVGCFTIERYGLTGLSWTLLAVFTGIAAAKVILARVVVGLKALRPMAGIGLLAGALGVFHGGSIHPLIFILLTGTIILSSRLWTVDETRLILSTIRPRHR